MGVAKRTTPLSLNPCVVAACRPPPRVRPPVLVAAITMQGPTIVCARAWQLMMVMALALLALALLPPETQAQTGAAVPFACPADSWQPGWAHGDAADACTQWLTNVDWGALSTHSDLASACNSTFARSQCAGACCTRGLNATPGADACRKHVDAPGTCSGNATFSIAGCASTAGSRELWETYCVQLLYDDEWADSNHDFRMDGGLGGLPKAFVGSLHVMFPHQVWHVPARYELSFDAPAEATVNVALWFNNDSSYYVRNGWDPHDAAYCNTEMPITLSRAGFEYRPHSPGVPYDTQTDWDPGHGVPSALWVRQVAAGDGAIAFQLGEAPSGTSCLETVGLAVVGACRLTVSQPPC